MNDLVDFIISFTGFCVWGVLIVVTVVVLGHWIYRIFFPANYGISGTLYSAHTGSRPSASPKDEGDRAPQLGEKDMCGGCGFLIDSDYICPGVTCPNYLKGNCRIPFADGGKV